MGFFDALVDVIGSTLGNGESSQFGHKGDDYKIHRSSGGSIHTEQITRNGHVIKTGKPINPPKNWKG
jgi:hypothetical protein